MDGQRYLGYSMKTTMHHYIEWYTWDHTTGTKGELKDVELYDKINDPYETVNVSKDKDYQEAKLALAAQLAGGWQNAQSN